MNTKMKMRMLSFLLCFVMLIGLLPTTAFARSRDIIPADSGNSLNMSVSASGVLTWDAVPGATGYRVVLTQPNITELYHWDVTNPSLNLTTEMDGYKCNSGQYTLAVRAKGVSGVDGAMSYYYTSHVDQLESPNNLVWIGDKAAWDAVDGATSYKVSLYNFSGHVVTIPTTECLYDFSGSSPEDGWTFRVQALSDGTWAAKRYSGATESPAKGSRTRTITEIDSGNSLNMSVSASGVLTWDAVPGATGYRVVLTQPNITELYHWDVTNPFLNLTTEMDGYKCNSGQYTLAVRAKGVSGVDGAMSYYYTSHVDQLESPNNLVWIGDKAAWDAVDGATSYKVSLYNFSGHVVTIPTTECLYDFSGSSPEDGWTFRVQALSDGTWAAKRYSGATESPAYETGSQSNTYTVTYDANGGSGSMGTDYIAFENDGFAKTYTFPECGFTAPAGKEFDKWQWYYNDNPSKTTDTTPGNNPWIYGNITVKALWKDKEGTYYTVTYDANGGSGSMESEHLLAANDGFAKTYTFPQCGFTAPDGKEFDKWQWYYNDNPSKTNEIAPGNNPWIYGNITVKALWKDLPEYMVAYNANGGEGTMTGDMVVENGKFTLEPCTYSAPEGYKFKAWAIGSVNGEQKQPGEQITITGETCIYAIWEKNNSVSGQVTSFNDASGDITLQLIPQGLTEPSYETIVMGNTVNYNFANVAAGTYTLKVSKVNHVTREYTVVVGNSSVIQDVKIHLKGDVDGNGTVTTMDFMRANSHARGVTLLTDYALKCADVVGTDGTVTTMDAMRINAHAKKTNLLW